MPKSGVSEMGVKEIIEEQWMRINPYFEDEFINEDRTGKKNIIQILDDLYVNTEKTVPGLFVKPLGSFADQTILRGRRGNRTKTEELNPPTIEVAKKNHIINRWNPPDKRYLYVSFGEYENALETVEAEMRAKPGEEITVGEFKFKTDPEKMLIADLDYDQISRNSIFGVLEEYKNTEVSDIVTHFSGRKVMPSKKEIMQQIEAKRDQTTIAATAFCGALTLKEICDTIFVPLDTDEDNDPDKKDKCYKSFHILAEYYESKGYAGISFSSTRMKLMGKTGSNLVLFDADCAEATPESLRVITI